MHYYIGVDLGTSAVKLILIDETGAILQTVFETYPLSQPQPHWSEQNPEDWWNAVCEGLSKLTAQFDKAKIRAIGVGGQMHGLVMLDGNDRVLRRSIIWCDQRTASEAEIITDLVGRDKLIEITANPALTGFTAAKIMWVKRNEPEIFDRCRKIMLPKDYIRYRMTGEFATEVSDASGMQPAENGRISAATGSGSIRRVSAESMNPAR